MITIKIEHDLLKKFWVAVIFPDTIFKIENAVQNFSAKYWLKSTSIQT